LSIGGRSDLGEYVRRPAHPGVRGRHNGAGGSVRRVVDGVPLPGCSGLSSYFPSSLFSFARRGREDREVRRRGARAGFAGSAERALDGRGGCFAGSRPPRVAERRTKTPRSGRAARPGESGDPRDTKTVPRSGGARGGNPRTSIDAGSTRRRSRRQPPVPRRSVPP
jgi:hypothetical protein